MTKSHSLTNDLIGPDSEWQTGLPWMTEPTDKLPHHQPLGITDPMEMEAFEQELFPDLFCSMVDDRELLLADPLIAQPPDAPECLFEDSRNCPLQDNSNGPSKTEACGGTVPGTSIFAAKSEEFKTSLLYLVDALFFGVNIQIVVIR